MRGAVSPCGSRLRRTYADLPRSALFPRWEPGFEEAETPYDLGYAHALEIDGPEFPRAGCVMTKDQFAEYVTGFWAGKRDRR